ncbi:MAG: short-chain dehydrogenase [Rhodopila sp.]|nr:short-chain dehydrogenase [Rhodopila sp.]
MVTGVGPGTGRSVVQRLTQGGYEVAIVAGNEERLWQFEADIPGIRAFPADVTNASEFIDALDQISADFGAPEVVIHNAVGGVFGNFMQIDPAILELNFQINVMAFLHLVRRLTPAMIEAGQGVIIASGNTSTLRGKSNFAGFAPTKQRSESMARDLGPRGVHVAYVLIESPRRFGTLCISPRAHGRSTSKSARSKKLGDQHEPAPPGYDRTAAQHRLACPDAFKALSASRSCGEAITSIPAPDASGDPTEGHPTLSCHRLGSAPATAIMKSDCWTARGTACRAARSLNGGCTSEMRLADTEEKHEQPNNSYNWLWVSLGISRGESGDEQECEDGPAINP